MHEESENQDNSDNVNSQYYFVELCFTHLGHQSCHLMKNQKVN